MDSAFLVLVWQLGLELRHQLRSLWAVHHIVDHGHQCRRVTGLGLLSGSLQSGVVLGIEQGQQLFAAQLAASQAAQNETLKAYMSGQLAYYNPRPVPAFPVPAPYQYGNCGNGCGCNGCA